MPEPTYKIAQRLLASRAAVGVKQYGDDLTANSPGCMLVHALEEAADQVNYLIAEIQRRKYVIEKLESLAEEMRADKASRWAFEMEKLSDLLGGPSALKQYDEILGGGTVAENATVDPRDEALRHVLAERNEFKQSSELSALRIRDLEAELAEARLDGARLQTALKAAMVVLSGQETSIAMIIRALELGRLAIKEAK